MYLYFFTWALNTAAVLGQQHIQRQNGPVPSGTISDCTYFYDSVAGDTCASIANAWGITLQQFITYNPSVKSDCSGLVVGDSYCVEENNGKGPASTSGTSAAITKATTAAPTSSSLTTSTGPSPTQTGITTQCVQYYKVKSGDTCTAIVDEYHTFSLLDFYSWNPAVGSNCETLFVGYYVCVGVPGTPTSSPSSTTSTTASSGPSPTQTGIISTCTKFYLAVSGDTCASIASTLSTFSVADFISWNPAVGTDCTTLFLGYYYCVAIPGTPSSPTSTSASSTPTPNGPQPQQPGIVSTCNNWYLVVSGDTCSAIEQSKGVSEADFLAWNTAIQQDCQNLFAGYWVCVGVAA